MCIREDVLDVNSITILEIILILIVIIEIPEDTVVYNCSFCIGKCCTVIICTNPIIRKNAVRTIVWSHQIASNAMVYLNVALCNKGVNSTTYITVLHDTVLGQLISTINSTCDNTVSNHRVRVSTYVDIAIYIALFHHEPLQRHIRVDMGVETDSFQVDILEGFSS